MRFDAATGEIHEDDEPRPSLRVVEDPEIVRLKANLEAAEMKIADLQRELTKKLGRIRQLTEENENKRLAYIRRDEVELWLEVWKVATGHSRSKLTAPRFDAIRKLIELGYTIEQWTLACEYVGALPFVHGYERRAEGTEKQRHDDVDLIARKIERFATLEWERRRS